MRGPGAQALIRRAAANPVLDPIEGSDPIQRLASERGLGCLMHIPELAPGMRHAGGFDHAAIAVEAGIPGISVRLEDAAEVPQMLPWVLSLAVRRIPVERCRRSRPGEWPVVANIGPKPRRAGPAETRLQHRHHGVVSMHALACHHMPGQRIDQWPHQSRRLTYHVSQRRAGQVDVLACVDLGLPMQRQMVAVFGHQHMREQAGAGTAAADRQARCGGLGDRLAGPAGQLRPHTVDHPERAWHVVQDLGHILAELAQRTAAGWAGTRCGVLHDIARQRLGQPPAHRLAQVRGRLLLDRGAIRVLGRSGLGQQLVDVGERQLKLLDPARSFSDERPNVTRVSAWKKDPV